MTEKKRYDIECSNCQQQFPKVIEIENDKPQSWPASFEVTCPFCQTLLTVAMPTGQALAPTSVLFRGYHK